MCKRTERRNTTDSLDWSRKFDIFSISQLSLNASSIPTHLIASLSDEDIYAIAERIAIYVVMEPLRRSPDLSRESISPRSARLLVHLSTKTLRLIFLPLIILPRWR